MNISDYIERHITKQYIEDTRKSLFGSASMFFFDKVSGEPRSVFADAECCVYCPNPLQANADGHFPKIHFEPNAKSCYKFEIQNSRAETILKGSLTAPVSEETE